MFQWSFSGAGRHLGRATSLLGLHLSTVRDARGLLGPKGRRCPKVGRFFCWDWEDFQQLLEDSWVILDGFWMVFGWFLLILDDFQGVAQLLAQILGA